MLERVERRALGGEHRAGIAFEPHEHAARVDLVTVARQLRDFDLGVERVEDCRRDLQAGHSDWLARDDCSGELRFATHRRGRGDIPADPEVFGQSSGDEFVEIEARRERHGAAFKRLSAEGLVVQEDEQFDVDRKAFRALLLDEIRDFGARDEMDGDILIVGCRRPRRSGATRARGPG